MSFRDQLAPTPAVPESPEVVAAQEPEWPAIIPALLATALIFSAVTGYGVLNKGFNIDDWRLIVGNGFDHWRAEGRWGLYLIFRYMLQGEYHLPLQLSLAFVCFASISWMLARETADGARKPWLALLIFTAGVNFIYMADALNFNLAVFAFPLSLVLSLAAFRAMTILVTARTTWIVRVLLAFGAVQLLALSLAVYEPFIFFGAILPVLALIRFDRYTLKTALVLAILSVGLLLSAIALHRVEWMMIVDTKYQAMDIATFRQPVDLLNQLSALPTAIRRILAGSLLSPPNWVKVPLFAIALTAGATPALAAYIRTRRSPTSALPILRGTVGGLLVIVGLPALYWYATLQSYSPPRGLAYFGFWLAALLCSGVTLIGGSTAPRGRRPNWTHLVTAALLSFATLGAVTSIMLWRDRARLSQAELTLANDMVDALEALPGYTNQRVRLIGTRSFDNYNWGDSIGWTIFHRGETIFQEGYPLHGLFKDGFGNTRRFESADSDVSCPAFPAPGSVFMRDGIAYVCLSANGRSREASPASESVKALSDVGVSRNQSNANGVATTALERR